MPTSLVSRPLAGRPLPLVTVRTALTTAFQTRLLERTQETAGRDRFPLLAVVLVRRSGPESAHDLDGFVELRELDLLHERHRVLDRVRPIGNDLLACGREFLAVFSHGPLSVPAIRN
jgi:hypothetical protein